MCVCILSCLFYMKGSGVLFVVGVCFICLFLCVLGFFGWFCVGFFGVLCVFLGGGGGVFVWVLGVLLLFSFVLFSWKFRVVSLCVSTRVYFTYFL